ncbi:MAG TPA: DUF3391 domain-containing protein [Burkholderiaceae bacterium]
MKDRTNDPLIDVSQLKVGMFIHLDLGWMSHPFPLSSFRVSSEEQLVTIRRLGLKQVRWSPGKSDLQTDVTPHLPSTDAMVEAVVAVAAGLSPEQAAAQARREALAAERAAMQLCERQYGEAAQSFRELMQLVPKDPKTANDQSSELCNAMLDKMLVEGDLNIRLLNEGAGDRSTAHALNVSIIALLLGRAFGLGREDLLDMGIGALLHDAGKVELAAHVRHRDENFNAAELQQYQSHVAKGVAIGQAMGVTPGALSVIAQHHEHADGTGFPQKLNIDRMSSAARIVAMVNRFDGLCNPLVASKAMTPHEALSLMFAQGRNRFDPTMLNAFIRMMGVYPPGSTVQLTDDRYAMVVGVNSSRPLKPRVMVFDPKVPKDEALTVNLEEVADLGIRRSLKPSALPRAALDYLSPRVRVAYFFDATPTPEQVIFELGEQAA